MWLMTRAILEDSHNLDCSQLLGQRPIHNFGFSYDVELVFYFFVLMVHSNQFYHLHDELSLIWAQN